MLVEAGAGPGASGDGSYFALCAGLEIWSCTLGVEKMSGADAVKRLR